MMVSRKSERAGPSLPVCVTHYVVLLVTANYTIKLRIKGERLIYCLDEGGTKIIIREAPIPGLVCDYVW